MGCSTHHLFSCFPLVEPTKRLRYLFLFLKAETGDRSTDELCLQKHILTPFPDWLKTPEALKALLSSPKFLEPISQTPSIGPPSAAEKNGK